MLWGKAMDRRLAMKSAHIACVISSMGAGGAERVMATLANHWASQGRRITLITFSSPDDEPFFALDSSIRQRRLAENGTAGGVARAIRVGRRIAAIRREVQALRPDVVLSFIDLNNVMTLLGSRGLNVPVIVSERVDPHNYDLGRMAEWLRARTYPLADRIVVQTTRSAQYFSGPLKQKVAVLPNPIREARFSASPEKPVSAGRYRIIAVGRLNRQKGFDLLLAAFARIAGAHPSWDVDIYGDGPERADLERSISWYGLDGRVRLNMPTKDIEIELARSNVLAFPSRFEGFPNSLGEAMAAGLPAVAFRDVSGVEDLVEDEVSGLLGGFGGSDEAAALTLAANLERLMDDPALRSSMGTAARARIIKFRPELVLSQWDAVLDATTDRSWSRERH